MTLTLLIDLDDTLLHTNISNFFPAYMRELATHLAPIVPPTQLTQALITGTQKMFENESISCTLKDAFDKFFYPSIGIDKEQLNEPINNFYQHKFPSLKNLTSQKGDTFDFIEEALERQYTIGIATNPLFPKSAIVQRIEWAGLKPYQSNFALVPSYETFHFAKPNPAFFAEFLAYLGYPNQPVVMIGDDFNHDIEGAKNCGISAYYILNGRESNPHKNIQPDGQGELSGFFSWLENNADNISKPQLTTPQNIIAHLMGIPAAIDTIFRSVKKGIIPVRPAPEEWSLLEIICHLRDVDREVNLPRIHKIMNEDNPFIIGVDSDKWAKERDYISQDIDTALSEYLSVRQEIINTLKNLESDRWFRKARHAILGPTTLQEIVKIIVQHDIIHTQQIQSTLTQVRK